MFVVTLKFIEYYGKFKLKQRWQKIKGVERWQQRLSSLIETIVALARFIKNESHLEYLLALAVEVEAKKRFF